MVDRDELRALTAGKLSAPARVVTLDAACAYGGLDGPAAALAGAQESGCRATLRMCGFCTGEEAAALLGELALRLAQEGKKLAPEGLAMSAAVAGPQQLALGAVGRCEGAAPVYLLMPAAALDSIQRRSWLRLQGGGEEDARRWWDALLTLAAEAPAVSLVPETPGPGLSRLAPGQRWLGPSPGAGELIPAAPRRLRVPLDFGALVDASGSEPQALGRLAARLVTMADELLDQLLEPGGPRRLALELCGVARAVIANGLDPRSFAALSWLKARLAAFREGACAASVRLARTRGAVDGLQPFPLPGALEVAEADALDRALLAHGARHSHLVCMSPWSLAPPELGRDALGLMPALACADSVCWRRPEGNCPAEWYGEALRFAWAVALRS